MTYPFHLDCWRPPSSVEPAFIYALAVSSFRRLRNRLTNPQIHEQLMRVLLQSSVTQLHKSNFNFIT